MAQDIPALMTLVAKALVDAPEEVGVETFDETARSFWSCRWLRTKWARLLGGRGAWRAACGPFWRGSGKRANGISWRFWNSGRLHHDRARAGTAGAPRRSAGRDPYQLSGAVCREAGAVGAGGEWHAARAAA